MYGRSEDSSKRAGWVEVRSCHVNEIRCLSFQLKGLVRKERIVLQHAFLTPALMWSTLALSLCLVDLCTFISVHRLHFLQLQMT